MGPDGRLGARVPPHAPSPSPLAQGPFRRQTPEVGAVCGKAARTDLCGGRAVMRVPTAIEARCLRRRAPQDEGGGKSATRRETPAWELPRRSKCGYDLADEAQR